MAGTPVSTQRNVGAHDPNTRSQHAGNLASVAGVLAVLRARGGRVTSSRRLLLQALFGAGRDRTAEEILNEVNRAAPDVNISTVYRNLEELEELGVVVHTHLAHGPAMYNLASAAHGHLVCEGCGAVIEASADVFRGLSRTAKDRFGFEVRPYHFAVPGLCRACHDKGPPP